MTEALYLKDSYLNKWDAKVVEVKDGYARNFLFPRGFAYAALKGNIKALDEEKKSVDRE